jgi:hypothetical protein
MDFKLKILLTICVISQITQTQKTSKKNSKPRPIKQDSIYIEVIPNNRMDETLAEINIENLYNPAINPRDQVEFNFDFDFNTHPENSVIYVSYLCKKKSEIEFEIMDLSNNSVIYSHKKRNEFLGKIKFKKSEEIKFIFRNMVYNTYANILVGFACQNCLNPNKLASSDDMEESKKKLNAINMMRSQIYFMSEIFRERKNDYLKNLKSSHSKLYYFSIFEIFVIFAVNLVQILIIRNLISNKKIF